MEDCPVCGESYKKLGSHWNYNSDHRPTLSSHQKEIVTGLLMGDGCLNRSSTNPRLKVEMISPNYLKYLDDIFGCLSTGVSLTMTAKESAKHNRDSGFSPNANSENYSDKYIWNTRCHPELYQFNWYKTGEKVFPDDIELTPTVLKHWYCGDGHWDNTGQNSHISICMLNEVENTDKVDQYFRNVGLPEPSNYNIRYDKSGNIDCDAQFTKKQSRELWEYMGEPLPDFEYKWPEEYR